MSARANKPGGRGKAGGKPHDKPRGKPGARSGTGKASLRPADIGPPDMAASGKAAATVQPAGEGAPRLRFTFIDEFRGLVGVMMALGHAQYFVNAAWLSLDPFDPFFDTTPQFLLRYMGYLCAPGFLMMNGAMVYLAFLHRRKQGMSRGRSLWDFIQRGLFLVAVQWLWVNASWGGFARLPLDRLGIIATIGLSMILVALIVHWSWWKRAAVALAGFLLHPLLLQIPYDHDAWTRVPMQLLIDSGSFTKYPLIPWFSLALVGSVMAHFWFTIWTDRRRPDERAYKSLGIGLLLILAAWGLRDWGHPYANIFPHEGWFTYSFFLVQKYPPSLSHQVWFAGVVIFVVGLFAYIDQRWRVLRFLAVVGKVPLFFYCVHIPLLGIVIRRLDLLPYRAGGVTESLLVWLGLMLVMWPLAIWFENVKRRNRSWFIRMI